VPEVIGLDVNAALNIIGGGHPDAIPSHSPRPSLAPTVAPSTTPSPIASGTPGTSPSVQPSGSGGPSATPRTCPPIDLAAWGPAADGRLNILLAGSDSRSDEGAGQASIRTDSMMLLSIDIASCKAALFSFPRNMEHNPASRYPEWFHIPLEGGGEYNGYLFGLWQKGARDAGCETEFDCEGGWRALTYAVQQMANVQVDGVLSVNLKGFVALVDNLPGAGVWIDIPYRLVDEEYYNSQQQRMNIDFRPGCQFLDGEEALAFSRSRHQDSDYQRGRRQQIFLQQVRKQLDPLSLLPNIPGLLQVAQENLFMTFSQADFPYLAQVAGRVDADRLYRFDFAPARLTNLGSMDGMAAKVNNIFSEPEPEPEDKPNDPKCPPR
jgi:LCP family protein required for cell wall assembly